MRPMNTKTPVYDASGKQLFMISSAATSIAVAKRAGWKYAQFGYRCPKTDARYPRPGWQEAR